MNVLLNALASIYKPINFIHITWILLQAILHDVTCKFIIMWWTTWVPEHISPGAPQSTQVGIIKFGCAKNANPHDKQSSQSTKQNDSSAPPDNPLRRHCINVRPIQSFVFTGKRTAQPANMRQWYGVGVRLAQRRKRWAIINPTPFQSLIFAGWGRCRLKGGHWANTGLMSLIWMFIFAFSAGTDFTCYIYIYTDAKLWRLRSIPALMFVSLSRCCDAQIQAEEKMSADFFSLYF